MKTAKQTRLNLSNVLDKGIKDNLLNNKVKIYRHFASVPTFLDNFLIHKFYRSSSILISKSRLSNESGMVMGMVIMITMVILLVSATILSTSMNQSAQNQDEVDRIKAEQVAKGYFWRDFSSDSMPTAPVTYSNISVNQKKFTVTVTPLTNPNRLEYKVSY